MKKILALIGLILASVLHAGTSAVTVNNLTGQLNMGQMGAGVPLGFIVPNNYTIELQSGATIKADAGAIITGFPGSGNVTFSGTPASGQLALWVSGTAIQGVTALPAANEPAHTGDVTNSAASLAMTVAKIQGTTVTGTTGAGLVVFATSPTLVTPNIGAATGSSLNLTRADGSYELILTDSRGGGIQYKIATSNGLLIADVTDALPNMMTFAAPTGQPAFSYLAGGGVVISDVSGSLSNNTITGTGAVVFSVSPALTGNPTAPTQTVGNNTTRLATTAFVIANAVTNPMTTLGDSVYGGVAGALTRLAGNITTAPQVLVQTGNGAVSAAPALTNFAAASLSDYSAGSWTPTLNSFTIVNGTGGVSVTGTYIKIGHMVFLNCIITGTGTATIACSATTSYISGIPYNNTAAISGTWSVSDLSQVGELVLNANNILPSTWSAVSVGSKSIILSMVYPE